MKSQPSKSRLSYVRGLAASGLSVIPIEPDGSKAPMKIAPGRCLNWKPYQKERANGSMLAQWFGNGHRNGVAIVTGKVSGNLEVMDFDDIASVQAWREMVEEAAPGLLEQLPQVQTPTGGLHVLYRCESIGSNTKLAERVGADGKIKTLIETRGEGGYVVTVGSPPECHPSGKPYNLVNGDLTSIPTIIPTQRSVLSECANACNEHIRPAKMIAPEREPKAADTLRPGDDFNRHGDIRSTLERHGWKCCGKSSVGKRWKRPGGDRPSATLFNDSRLFYVFSTNAHPFEPDRAYSLFAVYALLEHGGDYQRAAKALKRGGYGEQSKKNQPNGNQAANISQAEEWEPPAPFYEFDLPEFPIEALPDFMLSHAQGVATATQTPVDLAALMDMAACGAAVARNVRIKARLGWSEPLNMFVAVALPPANRKSAVFEEAIHPLFEYERDLIASNRESIAEAASEYRILETELAELEKKCAKAEGPGQAQLREAAKAKARELAARQIPALPKLMTADVTAEALATLLSEQQGRIALFSTEGGIFENMAGRYSNGVPNIDVYLKGHSGDDLRIDRRGRSEHIGSPALTIGLAVQPAVLRGLIEKPGFNGRGLLERFLFALPISLLGRRKIRPAPLSEGVRRNYLKNVISLAAIEPITNYDGEHQPRWIELSDEADDCLAGFERELEPMLAEDSELGVIGGWGGKLAGAVVRIAGILHLAQHAGSLNHNWPGEVSADTLRKAIAIARYLIPHARAAYAEMGADPKIEAAKVVLRWIEKSALSDFTKRQAFGGVRRRFKEVAALEPALRVLEDHGYIRLEEPLVVRGPGRKPSDKYLVNPLYLKCTQNPQNPQNKTLTGNSVDSVDSVDVPKEIFFDSLSDNPSLSDLTEWPDFPFSATWRNSKDDRPVTITSELGQMDGRRYVSVQESGAGIPADEVFVN